ncbi:MAG TPA: hypothetical protein VLS89_08805 [Candidatus Nanopelagicales bacterium]|nr:hypothetical protein [Candidatus Nanopelagicales bacterium]
MSIDHHELARFIARCNPGAPAAAEVYVERDPPLVPRLHAEILPTESSRVLLLGQTGVGKSTELLRLEQRVAGEFEVLRPPLDTMLDLRNLTWHEILVFTAAWAGENYKYWSPLTEAIAGQLQKAMETRHAGHGPPPPTVIQLFRNSPEQVSKYIELGRAQYWDIAEQLLSHIADQVKRPLLLLFDGLEKMTESAAKQLFYEEGRFIEQLPCRAVITAPLALSFQSYFGDVEGRFPYPAERLRAISCLQGEPGYAFFRALAEKRGASPWMSESLIEKAISRGGGLPRQFLQLLAAASSQALTDETRVEEETFFRATERLIDRWQYQLDPDDYIELEKPDHERSTATRARLLRIGALIEYDKPDGSLRLGVNPLVGVLVERWRQQKAGANNA